MTNALKELFGNIATAIRDKTGSEETMTPAEFPEKIGEISVNTCESVETTVELDFSEGDMVLIPESGQLFEEVNIPTPANLIPENIAEGVEIAGIIGKLAAGGGSVKTAMGAITGNGGSMTIAHGLGVVPDVVFIRTTSTSASPTSAYLYTAFGSSSAFGKLCNYAMNLQEISYIQTNGNTAFKSYARGIQDTSSSFPINNANADSFTVGGPYVLYKNFTYNWYAISGLT